VTPSEIPQIVTSLAHIAPVQVMIPAIDVDSPLVNLGLNADGTLEVPSNYAKAGWFTGGNYPGDPTGPPGLIAGHVDDYTGPAVFYELSSLVAGDEVHVVRADNTVAVFVVTATAQFPKDAFPADQVYAPVPGSEIVLITCTGDFNEDARSYLDNFVVRAALDMERSLEESNLRAAQGQTPPAVNQENA
jgi:sortase (surface protein transpeptidase)